MKYGYIDSIRGVAILLVILVHTSQSLELESSALMLISEYGQMGVQLFFVASGFTMCLSFSRRRNESMPVLAFYIRRFFRIAPMYYLGIIGYCVFRTLLAYIENGQVIIPDGQLMIPDQYTPMNILANTLFLHGVYAPANNNIVPGGWSIGTEMLFYLVFPMLMLLFFKRLKSSLALTISFPIAVFLLVIFIENVLPGFSVQNNSFEYFSILNQFPVFAVGIALFFLLESYEKYMLRLNIVFIFLLFVIFSFFSFYVGWIEKFDSSFIFLPFLSGISFLFLVELFRRVDKLNLGLLINIGQRSYSMYLVHFVFAHQVSGFLYKHVLSKFLGSEVSLPLTYLITVGASYIIAGYTYKYIEVYFIKLGSSLVKKITNKSILQSTKAATD